MRESVSKFKNGLVRENGSVLVIEFQFIQAEAAEENLEEREKFHEQAFGSSLKDEFFYQGDIDYFFQTESFGDLNLTGG